MHNGTIMLKQTIFASAKIVCLLVEASPQSPIFTPLYGVAARPADAFENLAEAEFTRFRAYKKEWSRSRFFR